LSQQQPKPTAPVSVNIFLANVKRAISGRYHAVKQKQYARRYLGEAKVTVLIVVLGCTICCRDCSAR